MRREPVDLMTRGFIFGVICTVIVQGVVMLLIWLSGGWR